MPPIIIGVYARRTTSYAACAPQHYLKNRKQSTYNKIRARNNNRCLLFYNLYLRIWNLFVSCILGFVCRALRSFSSYAKAMYDAERRRVSCILPATLNVSSYLQYHYIRIIHILIHINTHTGKHISIYARICKIHYISMHFCNHLCFLKRVWYTYPHNP